jgi:hypothetical protein
MFRFYAVPAWQLLEGDKMKTRASDPQVEPLVPSLGDQSLERILGRAEYRGELAFERAQRLLRDSGTPAVYARPPNDLPALLRTADQLQRIARQEAGEPAMVWRCECGARYAVPVSLSRPLSIRCDRCDRTIDLDPSTAQSEPYVSDPSHVQVNAARQALSEFFREAMSRGWPVLVAKR